LAHVIRYVSLIRLFSHSLVYAIPKMRPLTKLNMAAVGVLGLRNIFKPLLKVEGRRLPPLDLPCSTRRCHSTCIPRCILELVLRLAVATGSINLLVLFILI
jgi:hypothetical protein